MRPNERKKEINKLDTRVKILLEKETGREREENLETLASFAKVKNVFSVVPETNANERKVSYVISKSPKIFQYSLRSIFSSDIKRIQICLSIFFRFRSVVLPFEDRNNSTYISMIISELVDHI